MKRRNAIMAALSLFFLVLLLAAMVLAVTSGGGSFGTMVFGGFSYALLLSLVVLSFPILIFVMITIVLLVIEDWRATRIRGRHWWLRPTRPLEPPSTIHVETHMEGRKK